MLKGDALSMQIEAIVFKYSMTADSRNDARLRGEVMVTTCVRLWLMRLLYR